MGQSEWGSYVLIEHCDIYYPVSIELRVTDAMGNTAICSSIVNVSENPCPEHLNVDQDPMISDTYFANHTLSTNGAVLANENVIFHAGQSICLDPEFEVAVGAVFEAYIEGCSSSIQQNATGKK